VPGAPFNAISSPPDPDNNPQRNKLNIRHKHRELILSDRISPAQLWNMIQERG
jgi:hypothetical protein